MAWRIMYGTTPEHAKELRRQLELAGFTTHFVSAFALLTDAPKDARDLCYKAAQFTGFKGD